MDERAKAAGAFWPEIKLLERGCICYEMTRGGWKLGLVYGAYALASGLLATMR